MANAAEEASLRMLVTFSIKVEFRDDLQIADP